MMNRKPRRWLWVLAFLPLAFPYLAASFPGKPAMVAAISVAVLAVASLLVIGRDGQLAYRDTRDIEFRGLRFLLPPFYLAARERGGLKVRTAIWCLAFALVAMPERALDMASGHAGVARCDSPVVASAVARMWEDPTGTGTRPTGLVWTRDLSGFSNPSRVCYGVVADEAGWGTPVEYTIAGTRLTSTPSYSFRNHLSRLAPDAPAGCDTWQVVTQAYGMFKMMSASSRITPVNFRIVNAPDQSQGLTCDMTVHASDDTIVTGKLVSRGFAFLSKTYIEFDLANRIPVVRPTALPVGR